MEPIKISPHHLYYLFMFHYRGLTPERDSMYSDQMRENTTSILILIESNPNQLIRITRGYDSVCDTCPRNKNGRSYEPSRGTCNAYTLQQEGKRLNGDDIYAVLFGLESLVDNEPITAEELFKLMGHVHQRYSPRKGLGWIDLLRESFEKLRPEGKIH